MTFMEIIQTSFGHAIWNSFWQAFGPKGLSGDALGTMLKVDLPPQTKFLTPFLHQV